MRAKDFVIESELDQILDQPVSNQTTNAPGKIASATKAGALKVGKKVGRAAVGATQAVAPAIQGLSNAVKYAGSTPSFQQVRAFKESTCLNEGRILFSGRFKNIEYEAREGHFTDQRVDRRITWAEIREIMKDMMSKDVRNQMYQYADVIQFYLYDRDTQVGLGCKLHTLHKTEPNDPQYKLVIATVIRKDYPGDVSKFVKSPFIYTA